MPLARFTFSQNYKDLTYDGPRREILLLVLRFLFRDTLLAICGSRKMVHGITGTRPSKTSLSRLRQKVRNILRHTLKRVRWLDLTPFTLASVFSLVYMRRKRLIVRIKANISIAEIDLIFCLPLRGLI